MIEDRELDMWIAVKVMGWTQVDPNAYTPYGRDICGTPPEGIKAMWNTGRSAVPRYSSDIKEAWLVIDYMRERGDFHLGNRFGLNDFFAEFGKCSQYPSENRCYGKTMPIAICLAALKAVGVEIPE